MSVEGPMSVMDMARRFDTDDRSFETAKRKWNNSRSVDRVSPPASPVTPPPPLSPMTPRSSEPSYDGLGAIRSSTPTPVPIVRPNSTVILRNASIAGESDDSSFACDPRSTQRTISAPVAVRATTGGRPPVPTARQASSVGGPGFDPASRGTRPASYVSNNETARRKTSFAHEMTRHVRSWASRRDSEDSFRSMASEPVSYSSSTYVASDIWLAERKLDMVEDSIIDREQKRASKRRSRVADVFSNEAESQDFSSRIVRMLWANPVAHSPAVAPEPISIRSRRNPRSGQYRVQERGNVGSGDGPQYVNAGMPSVKSTTNLQAQDFLAQPGYNPSYPDSGAYAYASGAGYGRMYKIRRAMRKADVARWIRYRANLRADRKNAL